MHHLIPSDSSTKPVKGGGMNVEPCVFHGSNFFAPL
jgi:hypothetical protein